MILEEKQRAVLRRQVYEGLLQWLYEQGELDAHLWRKLLAKWQ